MRPALIAASVLTGCEATSSAPDDEVVRYDGIETRLLDDDLVNFRVKVANATDGAR